MFFKTCSWKILFSWKYLFKTLKKTVFGKRNSRVSIKILVLYFHGLTNIDTLHLLVTSELNIGSLLPVDQNQIIFPMIPTFLYLEEEKITMTSLLRNILVIRKKFSDYLRYLRLAPFIPFLFFLTECVKSNFVSRYNPRCFWKLEFTTGESIKLFGGRLALPIFQK